MVIRLRMIVYVALALLLAGGLLGNESFSDDHDSDPLLQAEWLNWCNNVKSELGELKIFETKAVFVASEVDAEDVRFIEFESIQVPYLVDEPSTISVRRGLDGTPQLRISYDSGLRIFAATMERNPIDNVFDKIVPELSGDLKAYVVEAYESEEGFTTQIFGGVPDLAQLRFEGYNFTTGDINCGESIEETLRRIVVIIASVSSDYAAVMAGEDVAYWSSNSVPGVVIRQEVPVSRGSLGPRVLWSGEFFGDDEFWQVTISFGVADQDRYDRLGALLANPALE